MGKREKVVSSSQPPVSLILPSIYLGPCSAASSSSFLTMKSITHVLSIGASPKENIDGVVYHRIPLTDFPSPTPHPPRYPVSATRPAYRVREPPGEMRCHCLIKALTNQFADFF